MNRRDLLKKAVAVPIAAAVAPLAIANNDGVALNSVAHPVSAADYTILEDGPEDAYYDFDTANLRYESHELSPGSIETMEIEVPAHEWDVASVCLHCGATQIAVENGDEPLACWSRRAKGLHKALVDSFNQTYGEALKKTAPWP